MTISVGNADSQLTTTATSVAGMDATAQITLLKATVCNTDSASHAVTVYRVPNAGTPGPTNVLIDAQSVAAGATVVLPLSGQTLINGQSLQALADTAGFVNLSVSWSQAT